MFFRHPVVGLVLLGLISGVGCASHAAVPAGTTAQFVISVPQAGASSQARNRNFEAPSGTHSVSFLLTNFNGTAAQGAMPVTFNTTRNSPGCVLNGTMLVCTESVAAIGGSDVYTVTAFDGNGNTIAKGQVQVNATSGQSTAAPITLSGTVASISVLLAASPLGVVGGPNVTIPVSVIAKDAGGATIMGTYNNPITLADSDASGSTSLSATTISDSSTSVTLTYDGSAISPATISAGAANVAASATMNAVFTPNANYTTQNGATYTYNETTSFVATAAGSAPSPAQTGSSTYTDTYTTGATFNDLSNLVQVHHVFVYPGDTTSYTQDDYYKWSTNASGANLEQVASHYNQTNAGTVLEDMTTVMAGQGRLMAEVPFKAGNVWDAGVSYTVTTTGSYGSENATFNANGSYNEAVVNPDSSTLSYVVNADGSADYSSSTGSTTHVAVPVANNGVYVIPVTPSGSTSATMVPDWYPGHAAPPSPLMSDKVTDKGLVAIPVQCNASSVATQAELLEEKLTQLDPLSATNTAATADTYYVSGFGLVCTVATTSLDNYDVMSGQLTEHDDFSYTDSLAPSSMQAYLRSKNATRAAVSFGPAALQTFSSQFHQHVERFTALARNHHATFSR